MRTGQGWLVDTHAHVADPAFDADRDEVLATAAARGVQLVVAVGADLDSSRESFDLARSVAGVLAVVGIHPHDAAQATPEALDQVRRWAADPQVVGLGETGLDYYRGRATRDAQLRALEAHLAIADEVDKPVVVHDRDAHADLLEILLPWAERRRQAGKRSAPAVLHCFSGDLAMAEQAIAAGLFVSFAGNVTFGNAGPLAEVARRLDLDWVVLETDCPYLSPSPLRGRRNEPANVLVTAQWLADQRGLTLREIAERTTANARRLFGLS
jgi:TatD DNase family protein